MKTGQRSLTLIVVSSLVVTAGPMRLGAPVGIGAQVLPVVDDFESGLPAGTDVNGVAVGFVTFNDTNSSVAISTTTAPPAPVPGASSPNSVLKMDVNVVSYAGFVHNFENPAVDAWVSQDWSAYEGLSFWLYGNNSGTTMFVDVLDNRHAGSTRDDAERWSIDVIDNFGGWQEIRIPFASLHRKEIGNGAPNDGLGLTEVHGWAVGTITTPAPQTYYVDNATLYGTAPVRPLTVSLTANSYSVVEGQTATVTARLSKPSSDPVVVDYATSFGTARAHRDYVPVSGTLTFPPNTTQQSFTIATIDDTKYRRCAVRPGRALEPPWEPGAGRAGHRARGHWRQREFRSAAAGRLRDVPLSLVHEPQRDVGQPGDPRGLAAGAPRPGRLRARARGRVEVGQGSPRVRSLVRDRAGLERIFGAHVVVLRAEQRARHRRASRERPDERLPAEAEARVE